MWKNVCWWFLISAFYAEMFKLNKCEKEFVSRWCMFLTKWHFIKTIRHVNYYHDVFSITYPLSTIFLSKGKRPTFLFCIRCNVFDFWTLCQNINIDVSELWRVETFHKIYDERWVWLIFGLYVKIPELSIFDLKFLSKNSSWRMILKDFCTLC